MFFIGGYLGLAVHLLIPAIPVAVEVGAIMASLEAAVALLPLSMAVLMAIMTGSGLDVYGLSWLSRSQRLPYASQSLETRKVTCRGQRWDLLIPGTGPHHTPTYRLQRP